MTEPSSRRLVPPGTIRIAAALLLVLMSLGCGEGSDQLPVAGDRSSIALDSISDELGRTLAIEDGLQRVEELARLLQRIPKTSDAAELIVGAIDESRLDRGDIELVLVVGWWTAFAPMDAFNWTRGAWRAEHPRLIYAVLRSMARRDPQTAVDAYHSVQVGQDGFAIYLQPIIVGWHESGNPGLVQFILSQPSGQLQQLALGTLARRQVLALGPEKSIEWAEQITSGEGGATFERQVLQRIASSIAELEPESAAEWVERLVKEEGASETLLRRVSGRWSRRDPIAAFAWLARFESSSHQRQAVSQTYNLWRGRAPAEAEAWLLSQGDAIGTWLAPATLALVKARSNYAIQHPDAAVDWDQQLALAMRIVEPTDRWAAVAHLCRVWIARDEAATVAWMETNAVPETFRTKILSVLKKEGMKPRDETGA